jgi:hypothetical protein
LTDRVRPSHSSADKGARDWEEQCGRDFADDRRNVLALSAKANFDKAFRDANAWLPPNLAYRLWVSANEKRAMTAVLDHC